MQPDHNTANQTNTTSRVQLRGDPITALMERSLDSYLHMARFIIFFSSQIIVSLRMRGNTRKCSVTVFVCFPWSSVTARLCKQHTPIITAVSEPPLRGHGRSQAALLRASAPRSKALAHTAPHAHARRRQISLCVDITSKKPNPFSSAAATCLRFHVCKTCPFLAQDYSAKTCN